jgi:hypothetical protein
MECTAFIYFEEIFNFQKYLSSQKTAWDQILKYSQIVSPNIIKGPNAKAQHDIISQAQHKRPYPKQQNFISKAQKNRLV